MIATQEDNHHNNDNEEKVVAIIPSSPIRPFKNQINYDLSDSHFNQHKEEPHHPDIERHEPDLSSTFDEDEEYADSFNIWSVWTDRRVKKYRKTFIAAFGLLIAGIVFLIVAIVETFSKNNTGGVIISFYFIALVCGIPGGYQSFVLYKALSKSPGYRLSEVPNYDDDEHD